MLSTKVVGNVSQAKHYFLGHDNYYKEEDSLAKDRSDWWGKGAKALGLEGTVDTLRFTELLKGILPSGEQLGKKINNQMQHRPGFDLTFSAPKSVSLLAMLGGDDRIFAAMQRATDKTLTMIERSCAQARVTKNGMTAYENTKNLVVAKFLHDISREADPQLHVHCVVMNMTRRNDGHWRSLASQSGKYGAEVLGEVNGFLERVRHHKLHFGSIFRAELAYEVRQLGYSIIRTGKDNFFEIEGISPQTIKAYSQRSKQIDEYMQEYGLSSAKAAAIATLQTRKAKENINRDTLDEVWKVRSEVHNINAFDEAKAVVAKAQVTNKIPTIDPPNHATANRALQYAMSHLSETEIVIKDTQLINVAMQYALGEQVTIDNILQAIDNFQKQGDLICLEQEGRETCFITRQSLEHEKSILEAISEKVKSQDSIAPAYKIEAYLSEQTQLNEEQKHAIRTLFLSDNRINVLDGITGSGKTTLLKPMLELAKLNGFKAVVLTPNTAAIQNIQEQIRPFPKTLREWVKQLFDKNEYHTVSGYIQIQQRLMTLQKQIPQKGIIFVDNATRLSAKQLKDIIEIAQKTDQYLISIGDKKAQLLIQIGTPYTQILEKGVYHISLTKNMREQDGEIKSAISNTLQNNIATTFEKIEHRIIAIDNKEERLNLIAAHYVGLPENIRQQAFVLMPTKAQCDEMNQVIRKCLKKEGLLGVATTATVLLPKYLSAAQYISVQFYKPGQIIRFNDHYASLGIHRYEYLRIKEIHSVKNQLVLENTQGKILSMNPAKFCNVPG